MSNGLTQDRLPDAHTVSVSGERLVFLASLPPIQSAISFDGLGEGARIKLDVPATDAEAVLLLAHLGAKKLLKVTIDVIEA